MTAHHKARLHSKGSYTMQTQSGHLYIALSHDGNIQQCDRSIGGEDLQTFEVVCQS